MFSQLIRQTVQFLTGGPDRFSLQRSANQIILGSYKGRRPVPLHRVSRKFPPVAELRVHKNITSRFRPDRFPKTCQVSTELNLLWTLSLLYHQTMSILAGSGELSPAHLAQQVLTLPPFQHVSQEDFRTLLRHLLETDHLQQTETKGLIIGLAGEKVVRNFRFYAVFADNEEFTVRHKAKEIGTIVIPPPPGERFRLAGRTWEVLEVDAKRRLVFVERVSGKVSGVWRGAGGEIHTKIVQRMKQVLIGNDSYSYLQPEAQERLAAARHLALQSGLHETNIVDAGGDSFFVFPWMGTVAHRTLDRYLKKLKKEGNLIRSVANYTAFDSHVRGPKTVDDLRAILEDLLIQTSLTEADLVAEGEAPPFQKYDEHLPPALLAKAFVGDHLNLGEVREHIRAW